MMIATHVFVTTVLLHVPTIFAAKVGIFSHLM